MRPSEIGAMRAWARRHQAALQRNWDRAVRLEPVQKIEDRVLQRITSAQARPDFTVDIGWDDGSNSSVGFTDIVGRGVAAPLADAAYFVREMSIADSGYALAWPAELEFSADSLWYKTHPDDARRDIEAAE